MGQRANLLIVASGEYRLYYSHWCANTLDRDLFWGPKHAVSFIEIQRRVDESGWLDDVWAEGGAVVDCDKQVLLLFGGEDISYEVPLRRAYLTLLRRVWDGWQVRWAFQGIADIADYVGYPRSNLLVRDHSDSTSSLDPPKEQDWTDTICSVRQAGGALQLFPLAGDVAYYLNAGPAVVPEPNHPHALPELPLDEWMAGDFPSGGFHIDVGPRTMDFWSAKDVPDLRHISQAWKGWEVHWHHDEYERQLAATDGRLRLPTHPVDLLNRRLQEGLLCVHDQNAVGFVREVIQEKRLEGKNVKVNPFALRDDRLELSRDERLRILAAALGE